MFKVIFGYFKGYGQEGYAGTQGGYQPDYGQQSGGYEGGGYNQGEYGHGEPTSFSNEMWAQPRGLKHRTGEWTRNDTI